jgi:GxxExxY protein
MADHPRAASRFVARSIRTELIEEKLTESVIGAFYSVYNILGFGFLESVYAAALTRELQLRGHKVDREVGVQVWYKGMAIAWYRLDMVVDDKLVVENKAGHTLPKNHGDQLYNYLRSTRLNVGLLLTRVQSALDPAHPPNRSSNRVDVTWAKFYRPTPGAIFGGVSPFATNRSRNVPILFHVSTQIECSIDSCRSSGMTWSS